LIKRFCKYCEKDITDDWPKLKKVCSEPGCIKKHKDFKNADMRIRNRMRYIELKRNRMKGTTCLKCNIEIPIEQDLRIPVCLDPECIKWWDMERSKRRLKLQQKRYYNKKGKRPKVTPKRERFDVSTVKPDDFFDQKMYEKQQAKLEKPNGRTCQWPTGCNEKLTGNFKKLCPFHHQMNSRRGDIIRWENGWDGTNAGLKRASPGL
jgi:hypothetical protein